jgi:hypothetical protein
MELLTADGAAHQELNQQSPRKSPMNVPPWNHGSTLRIE